MIKTSSLLKGIQTSNIRKRELFMLGFVASLIMFIVTTAIIISIFIIFLCTDVLNIQALDFTGMSIDPTVDPTLVDLTASQYLSKIN
jgi:hypothetical protein